MAESAFAFSMAELGNALRLSVTGPALRSTGPGVGGGGGRGLFVRLSMTGLGGRGVGGRAGDPDCDS
jgi:hypothetical protein